MLKEEVDKQDGVEEAFNVNLSPEKNNLVFLLRNH
jgi:hypothetical protein